MIYDIFPFNNELDLLEIRLNTLKDIVDKFVLTESPYTFSGDKKPLYFNENKDRFKEFNILHMIAEEMPYKEHTNDRLHRKINEVYQKNISMKQFNMKSGDVYIIGDVDEIPNPHPLQLIINSNDQEPIRLKQKLCYYYFNCRANVDWITGTIVTRKINPLDTFTSIREDKGHKILQMHGGWHFSYLGDIEAIKYKVGNLVEVEFDLDKYKDKNWIQHCIDNHVDIFERNIEWSIEDPIDVPQYVLDNMDKFGKYFYKGE